jgi:hypothetical protein
MNNAHVALQAWLGTHGEEDLAALPRWRGENALLREARDIKCDLRGHTDVLEALQSCAAAAQCDRAHQALTEIDPATLVDANEWNALLDQAANLVWAQANAVLAVYYQRNKLDAKCRQAIVNCLNGYQRAWPIVTPLLEKPSNFQSSEHDTVNTLLAVVQAIARDGTTVDNTHYLILARLFSYLAGTGSRISPHRVDGKLLMADDTRGLECSFAVERDPQLSLKGWYPDPVALGLTLLNRDFLDSMCVAWRLCQPASFTYPLRLRIQVDQKTPALLQGGSAGAIFACGMYAAATGESLADDVTLSGGVKIKAGIAARSELGLNDVELTMASPSTLWQKIQNTTCKRIGVHRDVKVSAMNKVYALEQFNQDDALQSFPAKKVELCPYETLGGAWKLVHGFPGLNQLLEAHARRVAQNWA